MATSFWMDDKVLTFTPGFILMLNLVTDGPILYEITWAPMLNWVNNSLIFLSLWSATWIFSYDVISSLGSSRRLTGGQIYSSSSFSSSSTGEITSEVE